MPRRLCGSGWSTAPVILRRSFQSRSKQCPSGANSPVQILPSWRWVGDDGGVNIRNVLAGKYTPQQIDTIIKNAKKLPYHEQVELMSLLEAYEKQLKVQACQTKFIDFVKEMWPAFIPGRHHAIMADAFERVAEGKCKRLIINMAPRHTKSEFSSYLLPAWFLGRYPGKKIIQTAHTAELAVGFGRKVRNLVGSSHYQTVFPGVALSSDSKAAGRWNTNKQGDYFAIGVGGAVTGKGADLLIIDDPHSEQEAALAATNPDIYDSVYEWYTSGPRQRLQPGGAIVIVMTRWSKRDLCGQILKASMQRDGMDEWEVIEFPAIMPSGQPLWPEFWSLEELNKIRAELPVSKWSAQYQQNPTSEEGALIKRDWWKIWDRDDPPACDYIIQSWDTALTKGTRSDYSACTTWGVFYDSDSDGKKRTNIILLNAFQDKLEFPELKQKALEEYKYWKPDSCIIEAKAAGAPLVFEMRRMGIPIQDYTPSRGNDKIARVNAVSDIFASGFVYAPPLRWAEEVIEQFASFPNSDHDDLVDSSTQALLRFRQGGFISTQSDEDEEPISRKKADYY